MNSDKPLDYRSFVNVELVRELITDQFPQWAHLPIAPVAHPGWDNLTFHLGRDHLVRLPSAPGYAGQVPKEHRWLPILATKLPVPIPTPLGLGTPSELFPQPWSVYSWLDGETAAQTTANDMTALATDVAEFLLSLQQIETAGEPPAGAHSAYRGSPLVTYDQEVATALEVLGDSIPLTTVKSCWEEALSAPFLSEPVWFHGDIAPGNLLVSEGRLSAVIDFGCAGVGDPACDLVIAWTLFAEESREAFRTKLAADPGMWARARGWTLWKAVITLAGSIDDAAATTQAHEVRVEASRIVTELISKA